jgi:hypothetical protein
MSAASPRLHLGDDGGHRRIDVGGNLALLGEERGERFVEALGPGLKPLRHQLIGRLDRLPC